MRRDNQNLWYFYDIFITNMEIADSILVVLNDQLEISLLELQVEKIPYTLLEIFQSFILNILETILFSNLLPPLPLQFILLRVEVSSDYNQ